MESDEEYKESMKMTRNIKKYMQWLLHNLDTSKNGKILFIYIYNLNSQTKWVMWYHYK